ncbi:MAG TPA: hypothetical protein VF657_03120, partial [Actinoplanes sp.]
MAFRTWARILLAAFGVGALAGASQLGVAYGLGVVRLTRIFDVTTRDQWTAQLAWVAWFPVVAAVIGALVGGRLVPRWVDASVRAARTSDDAPEGRVGEGALPMSPGSDSWSGSESRPGPDGPAVAGDPARAASDVRGLGWSVAVSVAAGLGAAIVVPLTMQPARTAQVVGVDPVFVIAVCAALGAVIGACAGLAALLHPVARRSVTVVVAAVWAIALISLAPSLALADRLPAVRLGVFDAAFLSPATTQRTALFTMPALALLSGAALGWVARREGRTPVTVALAGLPGPFLLTSIYLIAGPGNGPERYQLVPYWAATAATFAGILGSALAAVLRRNEGATTPADPAPEADVAGPTLAPPADRPPLPRRRTGSAEAVAVPAPAPAPATTGVPPDAHAPGYGSDPARFDFQADPDRSAVPAAPDPAGRAVPGLDDAEPDDRGRGRSGYGHEAPRQPVIDPPGYLRAGVVPSAPAPPERDRPAGTRPGERSFLGSGRAPVELPDTPAPAPFDGFSPADTGSLRRDHLAPRGHAGTADIRPPDIRPPDIRPPHIRTADMGPADAPSGTVPSDDSDAGQGRPDDRGHPWVPRGGRHGTRSATQHPAPAEEDRSAAVHDVPRPATSPYIATPVADPPVTPARSAGGVLSRLPKLGFGRDSRRTDEPAPPPGPGTTPPPELPTPSAPAPSWTSGADPFFGPPTGPPTGPLTGPPTGPPTGPAPESSRYRVPDGPPGSVGRIAPTPRPDPIPQTARPMTHGPRPDPVPEAARPMTYGPRPDPVPEAAHPMTQSPRPDPIPEPPRATPTMSRTRPPTRVGPVATEPQPV